MYIDRITPFENALHDSVFENNLLRGPAIYRTALLLNYLSAVPFERLPYVDALYGQALFRKWKTTLSHKYGYQYLNDLIFPADWLKASGSDDPCLLGRLAMAEASPYLSRLNKHIDRLALNLDERPFLEPNAASSLRLFSEFVARNASHATNSEEQANFTDAISLHQIVTRYLFSNSMFFDSWAASEQFPLFILPADTSALLNAYTSQVSASIMPSYRCMVIASSWAVASLPTTAMDSSASKNRAPSRPEPQSSLGSVVELSAMLFSFTPRLPDAFTKGFGSEWVWSITQVTEHQERDEILVSETQLLAHWASDLSMFILKQESNRRTDETMELIDYALAA